MAAFRVPGTMMELMEYDGKMTLGSTVFNLNKRSHVSRKANGQVNGRALGSRKGLKPACDQIPILGKNNKHAAVARADPQITGTVHLSLRAAADELNLRGLVTASGRR